MPTLETLGAVNIIDDNDKIINSKRMRGNLLIIYLAEKGKIQSRKEIARLFWPKSNLSKGLASLRTLLNRMKAEGLEHLIEVSRNEVDLNHRGSIFSDLALIRQFAKDLHACTLEELQSIFDIYRGPFLEGIDLGKFQTLSDWAFSIQHEVEVILCQVYLILAPRLLASQAAEEAIAYGQIITEIVPDNDRIWALYIQSLISSGQISKALQELHKYRQRIRKMFPEHTFAPELIRVGEQLANPEQVATYRSQFDSNITPAHSHSLPNSARTSQNYAVPANEVIGREEEAYLLNQLLESGRKLITLVGLGGAGKTFFVRSQIPNLISRFGPHCYFVELRQLELNDIQTISTTQNARLLIEIANVLQVSPSTDQTFFDAVIEQLSGKPSCLILDNFETIIDEASEVFRLLNQLPQLTIITTSREHLNLNHEYLLKLGGLSAAINSEQSMTFGPAPRLFERATQRHQPGFKLNRDNCGTVIKLCSELGGLPLAIELMAKQLSLFTLEELISDQIDMAELLSSDAIDLPAQHRSIFKLLESMWQTLSQEAKNVLPDLTRFSNQWSREVMQTIAPAELAVYQELLKSSMLQKTETGQFKLHPLVKLFAAEQRSKDSGSILYPEVGKSREVTSEAADRYAKGLAMLDEKDSELRYDLLNALIRTKLYFEEDRQELTKLSLDLIEISEKVANDRKKIEASYLHATCLAHMGKVNESIGFYENTLTRARDLGLIDLQAKILFAIANDLNDTYRSGEALEKVVQCRELLKIEPDPLLSLKLDGTECTIQRNLGNLEIAFELTEAYINRCLEQNQLLLSIFGLVNLEYLYSIQGESDKSMLTLTKALEIAHEIDDKPMQDFLICNLAASEIGLGQFEEGLSRFDQIRENYLNQGDFLTIAIITNNVAIALECMGRLEEAEEQIKNAIAIKKMLDYPWSEAISHLSYGHILINLFRFEEAHQTYTEGLNLLDENMPKETHIEVKCGLAWSAYNLNLFDLAQSVADECWQFMEAKGFDGDWEWQKSVIHLFKFFEANEDKRRLKLIKIANDELAERANKIESDELRESYLTRIPANRQISELYLSHSFADISAGS